ncbi:MAG TPA: bifunctional phosphoserine phosphatase/homoserine phosphotransferase ThrH [Polyangiales bacterium]|nr:bifunctional phosphoserine phosphatase/homoserine phosphotransferase ThrH [Polyangiales bacterium]
MHVLCLDLEGVLIPEIWVSFAEKTGIDALRLTTREVPDYDELMQGRIKILAEHKLGLPEIQEVISTMDPLPGATDFLHSIRQELQLVILSDTFYEFAMPFMRKLDLPTLFCHRLKVAPNGQITGYQLRQQDPKRRAVEALKQLNFRVIAAGDSYNDTSMLGAADFALFFHAPENITKQFPQFPCTNTYAELGARIRSAAADFAQ